jgi:hypothetical protein
MVLSPSTRVSGTSLEMVQDWYVESTKLCYCYDIPPDTFHIMTLTKAKEASESISPHAATGFAIQSVHTP